MMKCAKRALTGTLECVDEYNFHGLLRFRDSTVMNLSVNNFILIAALMIESRENTNKTMKRYRS